MNDHLDVVGAIAEVAGEDADELNVTFIGCLLDASKECLILIPYS